MNHARIEVVALVLFLTLAGSQPGLAEPDASLIVPTDGMCIKKNTTFVPGKYHLPHGVRICASDITLDMNGAGLVGPGYPYPGVSGGMTFGVSSSGYSNVTIKNGVVSNYFYGILVEYGNQVSIIDNVLSGNYVDPNSRRPDAPWLDINVGPSLSNPNATRDLGGGLYMKVVGDCVVRGNTLTNQENGIDLFLAVGCLVEDNNASDNSGWGIHLYSSSQNIIRKNVADRCIRSGNGDSAGVLLAVGSDYNQVLDNSFQHSGDGFFIGNEDGCPSNHNLVQGNNGSFAGSNAFEATFSVGNQFIKNVANASTHRGFWLGFSHDGNVISDNEVRYNRLEGIHIEHGRNNVISNNVISGNFSDGILLTTNDNRLDQPCLNLGEQELSSGYSISGNKILGNHGLGIRLEETKSSKIFDNLISGNFAGTAVSSEEVDWYTSPVPGPNIIGGPWIAGNYWSNYGGCDCNQDGLGDTLLPYTNNGAIEPGDHRPLTNLPCSWSCGKGL